MKGGGLLARCCLVERRRSFPQAGGDMIREGRLPEDAARRPVMPDRLRRRHVLRHMRSAVFLSDFRFGFRLNPSDFIKAPWRLGFVFNDLRRNMKDLRLVPDSDP